MSNEKERIKEAWNKFGFSEELLSYERLQGGHINHTYRIYYQKKGEIKNCVLQELNTYVFRDPVAVMENISSVTEFIREKKKREGGKTKNHLQYFKAKDGKYYAITSDGGFWRCCRYIEGSVSFLQTDDINVIAESGKAFGEFQTLLSDFPVENLHIVIPHFHNTPDRFKKFEKAVQEDVLGRVSHAQTEIRRYMALKEIATKLYALQSEGALPIRVTHNDTKTGNVLFSALTGEYLSVIDLDTVMPGLVAYDFGDAIRAASSTCAEDEKDTKKVALNMEKYESFTRGFMEKVRDSLTETEKATLALGAVTMTVECGVRFLTDYLEGDNYFQTEYAEHNFVRARCQLALAEDMLGKLERMQEIVEKYCR